VLEGESWVKTEEIDYTYDVFNNLIGRQQTTYPSDGPATTVTQRNVFDGTNMVLTFDGSGNLTDRYLWGPMVDQVLADEQFQPSGSGQDQLPTAPGNTLWALGDNQNTVRDVVNDSGTLEEHIAYSPFGQQVAVSSSYSNSVTFVFGYTGAYTDVATADQLHGVRWYDPASQRWLSEDPIAADINLYRYCGNTSTNATDPTGLYGPAGHFYTTYLVLVMEGMPPAQAYELAYYSQLPDQLHDTDAAELGKKWGGWATGAIGSLFVMPAAAPFIAPTPEETAWAMDVYNWLHSMHGGNNAAVIARQKCLGRLLRTPNLKPWVRGFLIHALADAYAHTYDDGKGGRASYSFPWGHANLAYADLGHETDAIGSWPAGYFQYIYQLYMEALFFNNARIPLKTGKSVIPFFPLIPLWTVTTPFDDPNLGLSEEYDLRVLATKYGLPATIRDGNGVLTPYEPGDHNRDPTMPKPPSRAEIQALINWMKASCTTCKKNPLGRNVPPPSVLTNQGG
jgi:RHS repeat-associated protein